MITAQGNKYVNVLDPVSGTTGAVTFDNDIDTLGYDYCTVIVSIGALAAAMTSLKVQESDTSGSGEADVSGLTFDGGTQIDGTTASLPDTADTIHVFQIDCRARKRYLNLAAARGGSTLLSAVAILSRGAESGNVIADLGAAGIVVG